MGMIQMFKVIEPRNCQSRPVGGRRVGGVADDGGGSGRAVPAYVAYNYLVSRVQNLVLDMESGQRDRQLLTK